MTTASARGNVVQTMDVLKRSQYYRKAFISYVTKGLKVPPTDLKRISDDITAIIAQADDAHQALKNIREITSRHGYRSNKSSSRTNERFKVVSRCISGRIVRSYLDVGCGDCSITRCIGTKLGLDSESVRGYDIDPHQDDYVQVTDNPDDIAPKSYDLITVFVTFHHANVVEMSKRIAKWLAPGGIVLVREHDFDGTPDHRAFLNLIHMWVNVQSHDHADKDIGDIKYLSMSSLTEQMANVGLTRLRTVLYRGNNPQKLYYAAFGNAPLAR